MLFLLDCGNTNVLIRRLRHDSPLRELCGFGADEPLPHRTTFNRFINKLSEYPLEVETALAQVTDQLKDLLPGLGETVAVDWTNVQSWSNPNRTKPSADDPGVEVCSDPEAAWGVHTAARARRDQKEWRWGYKVHMIADAHYGLPLAQIVTPGNKNDSRFLPPLVERAQSLYDWFEPRYCLADRGYDSNRNHNYLDKRGVIPIIHIRARPGGGFIDGTYTTEGTPVCLGRVPMEYVGSDPERGHLYRCREGGCHLLGSTRGGVLHCDSEVWEDPDDNIRRIGRIPRASETWKALYRKRQNIEHIFKSQKQSRRLEKHCIRGMAKVALHAMMSTLTYQATVLVKCAAGLRWDMRWMVAKVA